MPPVQGALNWGSVSFRQLLVRANACEHCRPKERHEVSLLANISVRTIVLATLLVAIPITGHFSSCSHGEAPTPAQEAKLKAALLVLRSAKTPARFQPYVAELNKTRFRVVSWPKPYFARTAPWVLFQNIVWIADTSFEMKAEILADALLHEAVHLKNGQFSKDERVPYQVESDFLKAVAITGKADDLVQIHNKTFEKLFIYQMKEDFKVFAVDDPAITERDPAFELSVLGDPARGGQNPSRSRED